MNLGADCVLTNQAERLGRELDEATELEIERVAAKSSDNSKEVERLMENVGNLEIRESNLNTSLSKAQTERDESQASSKSLITSSGMDTACRDVSENLVYTNQCFKLIEAEFEDNYAATINAVNTILQRHRHRGAPLYHIYDSIYIS